MVFRTAIRLMTAKKPKPKMKTIELNNNNSNQQQLPQQTQTITRAIFDILKDHGPLTIAQTWDKLQEVGLKEVTSKTHMKTVMRWMRERQKLKLICNHVGPNKQFLYTTWFTKASIKPVKSRSYAPNE